MMNHRFTVSPCRAVNLFLTCIAVASGTFVSVVTASAELLDFNLPAVYNQVPYPVGQSYIEDGYRFQTLSSLNGTITRFDPTFFPGGLPNNGTPYFGATAGSQARMDRVDGSLFSISQIDLSQYSSNAYIQVTNVTIRGNQPGGATLTANFALSPFDATFHTCQFDSQWTNLESIDFLTTVFAWDNIVAVTVPEPATTTLVFVGLGSICVLARARTQRSK